MLAHVDFFWLDTTRNASSSANVCRINGSYFGLCPSMSFSMLARSVQRPILQFSCVQICSSSTITYRVLLTDTQRREPAWRSVALRQTRDAETGARGWSSRKT